jgi:hypothetical protein
MAKITFIILAHENAGHTADLARLLTDWDEDAHAVIHYDLKSPVAEFSKLQEEFANSSKVHLVTERIKCGWGDFSLVDATVRALKVIRKQKIDCERVMLVSGACMPIRPLKELSQFLDAHPKTEFIESFDANWITGGLRHERYQYWHFFNYQTQHTLFQYHYNAQRKMWPKRRFPRGLEPRFGSQWWCLSWTLCEKILDYVKRHPLVYFFFSTTWIPDEMFFQTMAFKFTPTVDLASRNLTFFHFNDWGKPLVFLDDHRGMFKDVPFFFARKISGRATALRAELADIARQPVPAQPLKINFRERYVFPFKQLLAAERPSSLNMPGLFQHREKIGWDEMLENCTKSFVILFGPPQLTRRAAEKLSEVKDLTLFGRLFNPEKIDFGPGRGGFKGLRSNEPMIRDYDTPGYFRRVLDRCDSLPVLQICPGDDPSAEMALLQSRNAIVLPIMPGDEDEVMQQLYWILCANLRPQTAEAVEIERAEGSHSPVVIFRSMLKAVDSRISREYRDRTETFLKNALMTHSGTREHWAKALEFQHGSVVLPLVEAYGEVAKAVASTTLADVVADMPPTWRQSVMRLSSLNPNWQVTRLNFPVILPELWTTAMQLQALALSKSEKGPAR